MQKLLVTGASGFLGWNICTRAKEKWDVVGLSNSHDIPVEGIFKEQCDITDDALMDGLFHKLHPDAVIHAAALSDPNYCETHAPEAWRVNVDASEHIAYLCKKYHARCAFTSTDLVFDGNSPPYSELDIPRPLSEYGEQKAEAENRMRRANDETLVCRMPLMFGDHPGPAKSFIQPMIENFLNGREQALFIDEFRTPISGHDAALGILGLIKDNSGIFHFGGKESISRHDFGMLLGKCLGLKSIPINPISQKDLKMAAMRPKDVSLNSAKAYSLGFKPDEPEIALTKLECVRRAWQGGV
jgi:dTDP-4-dehydrorhamnose reductase